MGNGISVVLLCFIKFIKVLVEDLSYLFRFNCTQSSATKGTNRKLHLCVSSLRLLGVMNALSFQRNQREQYLCAQYPFQDLVTGEHHSRIS